MVKPGPRAPVRKIAQPEFPLQVLIIALGPSEQPAESHERAGGPGNIVGSANFGVIYEHALSDGRTGSSRQLQLAA